MHKQAQGEERFQHHDDRVVVQFGADDFRNWWEAVAAGPADHRQLATAG
jgi:hypothetical protein